MNEAIRQVALDYLKPPFKFNCGYIFDAEGHMVADDGDWKNHVVRIRGWGAISYLESPEQLQDMIGTLVAEALTEFWQRATEPEPDYKTQLANTRAVLRALLAASRPVATAAYNIGQSHAEWNSIRGHIEKFDAATQLAREVLK